MNRPRYCKQSIRIPLDCRELARAASWLEAEGSIMLSSRKHQRPAYSVTIVNTDVDVASWLLRTFGGFVHVQIRGTRKPCYEWRLARRSDVVAFLRAVLPYMITSKQAKAYTACLPPAGVND